MDKDKLENYEQRLYETIEKLSPCPYCGCDRIVVYSYTGYLDQPNEWRIEHVDEKEAVTKECFSMYYAFGSLESALEHANTRDGKKQFC